MQTRFLFTLIFLLCISSAGAQFALERTYDHSLTVTRISATEYKYYLMDVAKSECRIYNLDHTLWKTIPISLPADYYLQDIKFVTRNLFNSDSNMELWYTAYNWVTVGESGYYRYDSKVIDEKGKELASIPNGAYAYLAQTGENQYKMTVYAYDNSFWPGAVKTYIFSIPGTETAVYHAMSVLDDPYPNPAGQIINLPLSGEKSAGRLQVFSVTGHLMFEDLLSGQRVYQLSTSQWAPGTYTYRIVSGEGVSESKRFTIR